MFRLYPTGWANAAPLMLSSNASDAATNLNLLFILTSTFHLIRPTSQVGKREESVKQT